MKGELVDQRRLSSSRRSGYADDHGLSGLRKDLPHQLGRTSAAIFDERYSPSYRTRIVRSQIFKECFTHFFVSLSGRTWLRLNFTPFQTK
jgi:hypothetical protein